MSAKNTLSGIDKKFQANYRRIGVWFLFLLHILVLVSCLSARGLGSNGTTYLVVGVCLCLFSSCLALAKSESRILHFMVAWLTATFTVKLAFCLHYPEDTPLAGLAESLGNGFAGAVTEKYAYFSLGFAAMVFTSLLMPWIFPRQRTATTVAMPATDKAFTWMKRICIAAFSFQIFTYFVLRIGRASIIPPVILFPGVTGALALISETGGLVAMSGILSLGISRNKSSSLIWALLAALVYIMITIFAGWKKALFHVVLCLLWYFFFLASEQLRNRLRPLILTFGALAVLLYFPVMTLRNYVVYEGMSAAEAARQLLEPATFLDQDFSKVFSKITDRFTGLEYFVIASRAFEDRPLGMSYLVNGRFAPVFTHEIMGVRVGVVTAIGSTLWGFFAATLGLGWLWICGCMIAVLIFLGEWLCSLLSRDIGAVVTCEFCFVIWLVGLVGTSGVFGLYFKKAIVLAAILYVMNKFAWGGRSMKEQERQLFMQWNAQMSYMR